MSAALTFVCSLAFEICLFTDTPQGAWNTFLHWLSIVKEKIVEVWNYVKHKVVGMWSDVEQEVMAACHCMNFNCGCCVHILEKESELNSTSKIVMVTEHLLLYIKVLCDVWCD
jgi:phage-related protein